MNSREPNGSGFSGSVNFSGLLICHWPFFVLCMFVRQGTSTPLKRGLVGKVRNWQHLTALERGKISAASVPLSFCSLSTFIQYLILVISWDLKGFDSYEWYIQDHNNSRTSSARHIKHSSFRILSLVVENVMLCQQSWTLQQSVIAEHFGIDIVFSYYSLIISFPKIQMLFVY